MAYDKKSFRTVRHGLEEASANCRHCNYETWGSNAAERGRAHAKRTGHTVDVYREYRTEYTSYVKEN